MGPGGAKLLVAGGTGGTPPAALLYPIPGPVSISVGCVSESWKGSVVRTEKKVHGRINNRVPDVDVKGRRPI